MDWSLQRFLWSFQQVTPRLGWEVQEKLIGMNESRYDSLGHRHYLQSVCWGDQWSPDGAWHQLVGLSILGSLLQLSSDPSSSLSFESWTFWTKTLALGEDTLIFYFLATFGVEAYWALRKFEQFSLQQTGPVPANFMLPLPIICRNQGWQHSDVTWLFRITLTKKTLSFRGVSASCQLFSLRWDTTMMKPKKTFKGHKKVGPGFPFDVSFVRKQMWRKSIKEYKGLVSMDDVSQLRKLYYLCKD